jgi:hypothetical protein
MELTKLSVLTHHQPTGIDVFPNAGPSHFWWLIRPCARNHQCDRKYPLYAYGLTLFDMFSKILGKNCPFFQATASITNGTINSQPLATSPSSTVHNENELLLTHRWIGQVTTWLLLFSSVISVDSSQVRPAAHVSLLFTKNTSSTDASATWPGSPQSYWFAIDLILLHAEAWVCLQSESVTFHGYYWSRLTF